MLDVPRFPDDSEETVILNDSSTAPTTPGGSMGFSPALLPFPAGDDQDVEVAISLAGVRGDLPSQLTPRPGASANRNIDAATSAGATNGQQPITVKNICCVGAGYVGGLTAAVIAFQNPHIRVTVIDRDETRIRRWNSAHPPIYEPGLADIVRVARDGARECTFVNLPGPGAKDGDDAKQHVVVVPGRQPNLFFSTDLASSIGEADVVLIAVNTPTKARGTGANRATDMASFLAVTELVAKCARPGAIIVEKSTVPCGTAKMLRETMAAHRKGVEFEILSNPEFLAAGTAVNDLLHPDRVLIGSDETPSGQRAAAALAAVYAAWIDPARILCTNVWSSELAKLVANSMLAQRISSINSIAAVCEVTGADVDEVAASIGIDPRIGSKFLSAGIGFGGSCFKKDVLSLVYLAKSRGLHEVAEYWEQVVRMNEYARDRFTARVIATLHNTLAGKKVTVLGYAFKKNTNDTRESPALAIIRTLLEEGPAEVAVYDPCCNPVVVALEIKRLCAPGMVLREDGGPLVVYTDALAACADSNAVLITTEFDEFRNTSSPHSVLHAAAVKPTRKVYHRQRASTAIVTATAPDFSAPRGPADPRPLKAMSELELITLRNHLRAFAAAHSGDRDDADPLGRFAPVPDCAVDCPDCAVDATDGGGYNATTTEYKPKERIDWVAVAASLRKPKWVFDGRGVIDEIEMAKLGVKVESVGRKGRH